MKTALLLLVLLAVAAGPAQGLRCHVCSSATNCEKAQICPVSSRYCRTMTKVEPLSGNLVEKDCVDSCIPKFNQPSQLSGGTSSTQCCQNDLCNAQLLSSAPARPLLRGASLGLALGLLTLILAPSL